MTLVARKTDTCTTGHSCDTTTTLNVGQGTVYAENLLIARITDPTVSHDVPTPVPDGEGGTTIVCLPHTGAVTSANSTVFAEYKLVTRINESVNCNNGKITSSASTVHSE